MNVVGIVCELNPMHRGHCALVHRLRERADAVVGVMSGPFVQRGEPAVMDKWDRAQLAIQNGFDLIVELPSAYVLQSAHGFALGAISVLAQLPVSAIGFGVEPGWQLESLHRALGILESPEAQALIKSRMSDGMSYRKALEEALPLPLSPNSILALEYLSAVQKKQLHWRLHCMERLGSDYHESSLKTAFPSATALRLALRTQPLDRIQTYLAPGTSSTSFPPETPTLDGLSAFFSVQEALAPIDFSRSPHFESGMEHRFRRSFQSTGSVEQACQAAANKRQSASRYRRMMLTSLLAIPRTSMLSEPGYLRPLAMNARGARLLREATAPVVQKPSTRKLSFGQETLFQIDLRAQRLYELLSGQAVRRDYRARYFVE
ncbi:MAG: nucleotidyltransferase family protein [Ndongobacter sp.]|nr:nucleotidyltransferase family protein [Ndongobacter sp.]